VFVELVPAEARAAEREIESAGRIAMEVGDGYAALKALLPPEERRGLVLIDPPYESPDELKTMLQAFADAYRRWPTGAFLDVVSDPERIAAHGGARTLRSPAAFRRCCSPIWPFIRTTPAWARRQRLDDRQSALRRR
jgi:hypothetical protein